LTGAHALGIVTQVSEWPATIDRRYHDAVILDLCCVVAETESGATGTFESRESTVPLLRRGALTSEGGNTGPILVECRGSVQHLLPGHTIEVS